MLTDADRWGKKRTKRATLPFPTGLTGLPGVVLALLAVYISGYGMMTSRRPHKAHRAACKECKRSVVEVLSRLAAAALKVQQGCPQSSCLNGGISW